MIGQPHHQVAPNGRRRPIDEVIAALMIESAKRFFAALWAKGSVAMGGFGPEHSRGALMKSPPKRGPPSWREILRVATAQHDLSPDDEWLERVASQMQAAPSNDEAIDIAELEIEALGIQGLNRAIAETAEKLERLKAERATHRKAQRAKA